MRNLGLTEQLAPVLGTAFLFLCDELCRDLPLSDALLVLLGTVSSSLHPITLQRPFPALPQVSCHSFLETSLPSCAAQESRW